MMKQFDLMEHISRLSRMSRRQPMDGHHISYGGRRVIEAVLKSDGMRAADLAEKLDIRPASLTDALKRLEETGHIRREQDANDSRVFRVYATDKARDEQAGQDAEHQLQNERLRTCLTEEEIEEFCRISDKLYVFFEQEYGDARRKDNHHGNHNRREHHGHGHRNDERRRRGNEHGEGRHNGQRGRDEESFPGEKTDKGNTPI